MEGFSTKTPRTMTLIRVMFYMMAGLVGSVFIALFTFSINEKVNAADGIIIAENAPKEFLAPFEITVDEVRIKHGSEVQQGDTLMTLFSEEISSAYNKTLNEYTLSQENVNIYERLLDNLDSKIEQKKKAEKNIFSTHKFDKKTNSIDLSSLRRQTQTAKQKLTIKRKRLEKEHVLYEDGVISESEYQKKHTAYLSEVNAYAELVKNYDQQKEKNSNISTDLDNKVNAQNIDILNIEYERIQAMKNLQEEKIKLVQHQKQLKMDEDNLEKLCLIAPHDGFITSLFNTKSEKNIINKGAKLCKLAPKENSGFYAKLQVNQEAMNGLRTGQVAQIKTAAFNHYEFGILEGKVTYIGKDEKDMLKKTFYILAEIPKQDTKIELKDGFKIQGDIITGEMKLYRYVFRNLFGNA